MAFTTTVTKTIQGPAGTSSGSVSFTASQLIAVDEESIPNATTDKLVNVAFTRAELKCIFILASQNVTLETNATNGAGGDVINLLANVPLVWESGGYHANPFTADVARMYFSNSSGAAFNLTIRGAVDATP